MRIVELFNKRVRVNAKRGVTQQVVDALVREEVLTNETYAEEWASKELIKHIFVCEANCKALCKGLGLTHTKENEEKATEMILASLELNGECYWVVDPK